jgi:hypothetical protein
MILQFKVLNGKFRLFQTCINNGLTPPPPTTVWTVSHQQYVTKHLPNEGLYLQPQAVQMAVINTALYCLSGTSLGDECRY